MRNESNMTIRNADGEAGCLRKKSELQMRRSRKAQKRAHPKTRTPKNAHTQKRAHPKTRTPKNEKYDYYCDFDHACREVPRRLDLGDGAGLFLCKYHFYQEANSNPQRFLGQIWENAEEYSGS